MGLGNLDIMLGIRPPYNLYHVIKQHKNVNEIIVPVTRGLDMIPGGSGIPELANLSNYELDSLLYELEKLDRSYDYMVVDTGAGISNQVLRFLLAADEVIVVTTPEPTSFSAAYGMIKSMYAYHYANPIDLVVNRARTHAQGTALADKMNQIARQFLDREINFLGSIRRDTHVEDFICEHQIIIEVAPANPTAKSLQTIAQKLCVLEKGKRDVGGIRGYFKKIFGIKAPLEM
jgi:flagellar biosynthesis protein FlhG